MYRVALRLRGGRLGGKLNKLTVFTPIVYFHSDNDGNGMSTLPRRFKVPLTHGSRCLLVSLFVYPAKHLNIAYIALITDNGH